MSRPKSLQVYVTPELAARVRTGQQQDLAKEPRTADLAAVHWLMRGTIADPLTAPNAARVAKSIGAMFNANAKALTLMPRRGPTAAATRLGSAMRTPCPVVEL